MINTTLIRLRDINKDLSSSFLSIFQTENPEQFLKTYYFCKDHDIPVSTSFWDEDEKTGTIEEINVYFGDDKEGMLPCIDVMLQL